MPVKTTHQTLDNKINGRGKIGWTSASSSEYSCCSSSKLRKRKSLCQWKEFITHYNELNGIFQGFIDEKQLNLLQQQTINKENIGHNYQGDNESTIICSNPVTSRWCGRPSN
ncbi:unnamed protein product [Rhizophagus irregularis]|nr:unnamed protein product [Rhizophagus irregularis]